MSVFCWRPSARRNPFYYLPRRQRYRIYSTLVAPLIIKNHSVPLWGGQAYLPGCPQRIRKTLVAVATSSPRCCLRIWPPFVRRWDIWPPEKWLKIIKNCFKNSPLLLGLKTLCKCYWTIESNFRWTLPKMILISNYNHSLIAVRQPNFTFNCNGNFGLTGWVLMLLRGAGTTGCRAILTLYF